MSAHSSGYIYAKVNKAGEKARLHRKIKGKAALALHKYSNVRSTRSPQNRPTILFICLDGRASLEILPYLNGIFIERALNLLVEGFVLVIDEVNIIAVRI